MASRTLTLNLDGIPIIVEYRSVKTLRLTVYPPDGEVNVSAPIGTSLEYIKKFATSKKNWIEKQRESIRSREKTNPGKPASLRKGSIMYVWGEAYTLELIERKGHPKILLEDGQMKMYVRPDSTKVKRLEFLDKWYSRILKETAPAIIQKWETITEIEVKKLYVRKMKTHWGSCNTVKQTLRLNSELAKHDQKCLEYVIVHEMLHIIEKGHNQKFYSMLVKYIPEWKIIRKKMNTGEI